MPSGRIQRDAADAFHLVIPSIPGYGFSGRPTATAVPTVKLDDLAGAKRVLIAGAASSNIIGGVSSVDVIFSEAIDPSTFTYLDITLTRNGAPLTLSSSESPALVSGTTYRINNLTSFTWNEGAYVLTVNASGIRDLAGNAGVGSGSDSWTIDHSPPRTWINFPADGHSYNAAGWTDAITGIAADSGGASASVSEALLRGARLVSRHFVRALSACFSSFSDAAWIAVKRSASAPIPTS